LTDLPTETKKITDKIY